MEPKWLLPPPPLCVWGRGRQCLNVEEFKPQKTVLINDLCTSIELKRPRMKKETFFFSLIASQVSLKMTILTESHVKQPFIDRPFIVKGRISIIDLINVKRKYS